MTAATAKETTKDNATDAVVLPDNLVALGKIISKEIKLNKAGDQTNEDALANLYTGNLPDSLPVSLVKELREYDGLFIAAARLAHGEEAIVAMKKHPELERSSITIPMTGKDVLELTFDRSRSVPNGEGATRLAYGIPTANLSLYATKPRGLNVKVKQHLAAKAMAAFGS